MVYRDEQHATVRAISVDRIGLPKPAGWQMQYRSGFVVGFMTPNGVSMSLEDMLSQDCITRRIIHKTVKPHQWLCLISMYAVDDNERVYAAQQLALMVQSPAGSMFRGWCVGCWAFRNLRKDLKVMADWDTDGTPERTLRRWRKSIHDQLNAWRDEAMIEIQDALTRAGLIGEGA